LDNDDADLQTAEDKLILKKVGEAIEELANSNIADITETDLTKMVEQFATDIKKIDSEYFRTVLKKAEKN